LRAGLYKLGSWYLGEEEEEEEGKEGEREGLRFARICGRILNAYNSKTVRARPSILYCFFFLGILPGKPNGMGLETIEQRITELADWIGPCYRTGTNGKLLGQVTII